MRAHDSPGRRAELDRWLDGHTDARAYAEFRAATEGSGRDGVAFHEYAQFAMAEQLTRLAHRLDDRDQTLYIDLPVGTHGAGYDVAARPDLFATDASVGAPPTTSSRPVRTGGSRPSIPTLREPTATATSRRAWTRSSATPNSCASTT